ncbi:MAG: endonuclease/exonuclease/phosphatase family protein [Nocardioidaceae bacterium]
MPASPPTRLRVATFNLLHGRSLVHGGVQEADLRAAATRLDADILGLQEVDRQQERSRCTDQTAVVAETLGAAHWRFVPAVNGTPGPVGTWTRSSDDDGEMTTGATYGVALVSRWPVLDWRVRRFGPAPVAMPLMVPGSRGLVRIPDEPRVALAGVIDGPRGPFTVMTAHLSFVPGWNVAQLRALARWAEGLPAPRLLVGDCNLPGPLPRLVSRWTQLARVPTYPSYRPRVQFDHVLADGIPESAVQHVEALRLPVSDHCALAVDLTLA